MAVRDFALLRPLWRCQFLNPASCRTLAASKSRPADTEVAQASTENNPGNSSRPTNPNNTGSTKRFFPTDFRFAFPDFLPHPVFQWRHRLREKLERTDMLNRRQHIEIPEFYVGSILAVTISDRFAPGRSSRFIGICITRENQGLMHTFTLRNYLDNQGVEIKYDLYNPLIQKIEVLKLERRLDDHLEYLRDALPEYSTFPMTLESIPHPSGAPIPLNTLKVKLKPLPWTQRWEIKDMKGIDGDLSSYLPDWIKRFKFRKPRKYPWERFDLMKQYREEIPAEDQREVFEEMMQSQQRINAESKGRRKKLFSHRNLTASGQDEAGKKRDKE